MPIQSEIGRGLDRTAQSGKKEAIEKGIGIPWPSDPIGSYLYYDCTVGVMLDSGIVIHNRLPQVNNIPDTLASVDLARKDMATVIDQGVNISCKDQYADIMQRMGHARYWFRLWGMALRVGYQVPIPQIKTIGGVEAIPYDKNPQWAHNSIAATGNYGGVPLWRAMWSLWYTTLVPPTSQAIPNNNPAANISGDSKLPKTIQSPYSQADDNPYPGILERAVQGPVRR